MHKLPLVWTIKERCRVCYTCVRECPAKAIRISGGQAEVMDERCIGCGNCVRVCSQQAKQTYSSTEEVRALLSSGGRVAACLAPSFPAEFTDLEADQLVGMVRALGFSSVHEVAFGADLVSTAYSRLLAENPGKRYVATTCPAVISFVERFHPGLVPELAPIVSPMIASARALRKMHGDDLKVVFVGPCLAKKEEAVDDNVNAEIDAVLTFSELRGMMDEEGLSPRTTEPSDFDPPHSAQGALFPISRGLLQAANLGEDLMSGEIVAADGRNNFQDAIEEFESGALESRLLEVLCCQGCIMGPGMTSGAPLFRRRARVSQYVREKATKYSFEEAREALRQFQDLDLSRGFTPDDQRLFPPSEEELNAVLARMGKYTPQDELNCGACGYETCREHALAILNGLAESEMCLPYTIDQLHHTVDQLTESHDQLVSTQEALMHSEKLASMGQLAAGIAHEVNNPLGVVLMYTHLLLEETQADSPIREDLTTIVEQTDRAKKIVAGLLNFARQNKVVAVRTGIQDLVDRTLRSVKVPENIRFEVVHESGPVEAELDADQMAQVLINLLTNAVAAMPGGGSLGLRTREQDGRVYFTVTDSGCGIPEQNLKKIFTPFFTTKQSGQGTGLGLAVTYGIVKMHRGDIRVESNADPAAGLTGTTFTVNVPARRPEEEPSIGVSADGTTR